MFGRAILHTCCTTFAAARLASSKRLLATSTRPRSSGSGARPTCRLSAHHWALYSTCGGHIALLQQLRTRACVSTRTGPRASGKGHSRFDVRFGGNYFHACPLHCRRKITAWSLQSSAAQTIVWHAHPNLALTCLGLTCVRHFRKRPSAFPTREAEGVALRWSTWPWAPARHVSQ